MAAQTEEFQGDAGASEEPEERRWLVRRDDVNVAHEASLEGETRFGRNRILKLLGGGLFGLATGMLLRSSPAHAYHLQTPYPCHDGPRCHCCNGRYCCSDCHGHTFWLGCPSGEQCWNVYTGGYKYRCCDWHELYGGYHYLCICVGRFDA